MTTSVTVDLATLSEASFEHEDVRLAHDAASGMVAVVAVHSTVLGPAIGGLRIRAYDGIGHALADALRLSRTMTYKNALAGLDAGGGKAVLLDRGPASARGERLRAFGRLVNSLDGRYVTAEDIGTTTEDMDVLASVTDHVIGRSPATGGLGDPSPATARTVLDAIVAAVRLRDGAEDLRGVRIGILGVGKVGASLASFAAAAGATVLVTDVDPARAAACAQATGARAEPLEGFLTRELDVLAPCATGELVDAELVGRLRCGVLAGAANNILTADDVAERLHATGILYVPDYVANCGGMLQVALEHRGGDTATLEASLAEAGRRTAALLARAAAEGRLPVDVARELAQERLTAARAA